MLPGRSGHAVSSSVVFVSVIVVVVLVMAIADVSQGPQELSAVSQSLTSTSTFIESHTGPIPPCGSPGVYCGPGFDISNASLTSASKLGENYSVLSFNVNGTYSGLRITSMTVWLANANSSEPTGGNGAHLVGKVYPSWSGKDGSPYSFNVSTTGFNAVKGAQCELWIDAYSVSPSPLRGDNWAMQNMTIG
jgi:hypothetical protein